ncbi:S53 family peptidase [Tundrisphaera lichenicola]|uniref:S53 family peptidase n=1 Tax=Tundrisphaera lichenicola TaxID=2029860 RepID=UPI003EBFC7D5
MTRQWRLAARPRLEILDERCVLSTITPSQLGSAYGLNSISFLNGTVQGNGKGQTIAIIDAYHDSTIYSDLTAFDQKYNLPGLTLTSRPVANSPTSKALGSFSQYNLGGSRTDAGWNQETALDVEWAHAVAPGANIILVEAASSSLTDMLAAVKFAKSISSVSVVSMSWGSAEFSGQTSYDSIFTTPSGHGGITFLASSGDSGAGAEWPASSPNVVSVGGTSLAVNSSGARVSETYWSGSGGGISRYEPEPAYQRSVQSTGKRTTPDVAALADPNTGVIIVSGGRQYQIGGTSLSSPIWAGLIAIADQGLAIGGKTSLDGATQTLPMIYAAPVGSFFDVTSGPGSRATVGYDTATGLGTPNAQPLISYLTSGTTTTTGTGGTTSGTGGTTTTGGGTTPVTPPKQPHRRQPPRWWYKNHRSGGFHARTIGQSPTGGWRPSWA